ncbi:MAG: cation diffusion facilitator family transporter [Acidobacteriaceae bacterium]|nr:cation diffusion facilitator family transporter [Acidobacteriaceae bacterium]
MSATAIPPQGQQMHSEKRRVAANSLVAALLMSALKLTVGLLTGSLALLSEAAHSSLDLIASGITLVSVQVSDRPADEDHNYGHGKIESLSAFFETILMVGPCLWIITEAIRRILGHHAALQLSPWTFLVPLLAIAVDVYRSRAMLRVARRHGSPALAADALHFSTDIWSSVAVLIGLVSAWAGVRWHIRHLQLADPIAALVVSAVILRACWQLARETVDALLDATPKQIRRDLMRELNRMDGVHDVERVRVRRAGNEYFVDLTMGLARNLTFQRSEQIVASSTEAVKRILPAADVVIHTVPRATSTESIFDRIRAVASRASVAIHEVTVQQLDGKLQVELHVEVDEKFSLREAHDFVTALEHQMLDEVPEIASILTHIESEPAQIAQPSSLAADRALEASLRKVAQGFPQILDIHDVLVSRVREHIHISCHCTLPDDLGMDQVHEVMTAFEISAKLDNPMIYRMLIHPEPATDNRR